MKLVYIFLVFVCCLAFLNSAEAGLFSKNQTSSGETDNVQQSPDEIPVRDAAFKIIEKRKMEAQKLISEGLHLMREGEKKKDEDLITKGRIKKEIGQKQLQVLKEQSEQKKKEDQSYGY